MNRTLSKRIKTDKSKTEVADLVLKEVKKYKGSAQIVGDIVQGTLHSNEMVVNEYKITIEPRDAGFSLELVSNRHTSGRYTLAFIILMVFSCFLLPIIALVALIVMASKHVHDPNVSPFDKIFEGVKEECELS